MAMVEGNGALILIGGNATVNGQALSAFFELARAQRGERVVGLMAASVEPQKSAHFWKSAFHSVGAKDAEFPMLLPRNAKPWADASASSGVTNGT